jgi:biotin carboxyl carrier protein
MSKYKVITEDGLIFEVNSDELSQLDIIQNQDGSYSMIDQNISYHIEIIRSDYLEKTYTLKVNDKEISLELKNELDIQIESMGYISKEGVSGGIVSSPMPGLVVKTSIQEGQEVEKGQALLVLEAMKMENVIKSPVNGVVSKVWVANGDSVLKKQVLLEIN